MTSVMAASFSPSRAEVISSSTRMGASLRKARAMETRWRSPPSSCWRCCLSPPRNSCESNESKIRARLERSEHDGNRLDREGASSAHRAASGKEATSSKRETMPQLEPPSRPMPSQFNTASIRRLAGRPAGRPADFLGSCVVARSLWLSASRAPPRGALSNMRSKYTFGV